MAIIDKHIKVAAELITTYDYLVPFHLYLNRFFKQNKKMGSRDRKTIKEAAYGFFRLGKSMSQLTVEEKIRLSLICKGLIAEPATPKMTIAGHTIADLIANSEGGFDVFFPCSNMVSKEIDYIDFCKHHLITGKVYFRETRKGKLTHKDCLADMPFEQVAENTYSIDATSYLNTLVEDGLVQIQDIAAQDICKEMAIGEKCWDVCAGAGGKSLHLQELHPSSHFFVSDIRKSILYNLKQRAFKHGLAPFMSAEVNLENPHECLVFAGEEAEMRIEQAYFDTLIADVPCSGSGVWRRNPENLRGFDCAQIEHYTELQKKIVKNALPFLKHGGTLHYITCSVFEPENVAHFPFFSELGLKVLKSQYYNRQQVGGDVLFHAELRYA